MLTQSKHLTEEGDPAKVWRAKSCMVTMVGVSAAFLCVCVVIGVSEELGLRSQAEQDRLSHEERVDAEKARIRNATERASRQWKAGSTTDQMQETARDAIPVTSDDLVAAASNINEVA